MTRRRARALRRAIRDHALSSLGGALVGSALYFALRAVGFAP